jgi:septal ring factor EnvC (AmiA/AmiB activator)
MQSDDSLSVIAFPQTPEARLRVALRQLDAALAEQRDAVAAFRRELSALGTAVGDLGESASAYAHQLSATAEDTLRARAAAQQLMAAAAAMERPN